jgi:hypothetical protein
MAGFYTFYNEFSFNLFFKEFLRSYHITVIVEVNKIQTVFQVRSCNLNRI